MACLLALYIASMAAALAAIVSGSGLRVSIALANGAILSANDWTSIFIPCVVALNTEATVSPRDAWEAGQKKAEEFIRKSVEYDDEDPICLDNMGQFVYRVLEDKAGAKEWFDKAYALKDSQIDTLYFLSRYDEEAGDREGALEKLEKAAGGRFSPLNYCNRETILKEIERLKGAN